MISNVWSQQYELFHLVSILTSAFYSIEQIVCLWVILLCLMTMLLHVSYRVFTITMFGNNMENVNSVSKQILSSEMKWSGGWRGRSGGGRRRGFYILQGAAVIHHHADVICDAFIHVEEGNRGRRESNHCPLTSLWIWVCFFFTVVLLFSSNLLLFRSASAASNCSKTAVPNVKFALWRVILHYCRITAQYSGHSSWGKKETNRKQFRKI